MRERLSEKGPWVLGSILGVLLALGVPSTSILDASAQEGSMSDDGDEITVETCLTCHEDLVAGHGAGPHDAVDRLGLASNSCVACHGDPTQHLEDADPASIMGFGPDEPVQAMIDACQNCHSGVHPRFASTDHAQAGLSCVSCHSVHEGGGPGLLRPQGELATFLEGDEASATCAGCHTSVFAEFEFNERHRLQEGIISCTDCHNPHEPAPRWQLGGFKDQACVTCHGDKGGPFIFEHGSSMVDGCTSCHRPHGSPNRHMLTFQSVADLCYSCHASVPGFHSRFTNESVCTNCHSSIHGSNFDEAFLH